MTAVLFDLDGTLLDTLDDLTASTNAALAAFSLPPRTRDEVRRTHIFHQIFENTEFRGGKIFLLTVNRADVSIQIKNKTACLIDIV